MDSSRYSVELSQTAKRQLGKLPEVAQNKVRIAFRLLAENPRPPKAKKLVGSDNYRVRVGDYRIIYHIQDAQLFVLVVKVGHRREIYDR